MPEPDIGKGNMDFGIGENVGNDSLGQDIADVLTDLFGFPIGHNPDSGLAAGAAAHGGADQGSIRDAEAARLAQANNEAARLAAEQARKEEAAAAAKRAADIKRQDEKVRAERARQIAVEEKARSRRISAMQNGKTSSILTSPQGVLNPVFTTSNNLWGLQPKFKKKLLGE
jgi:hypothetical protein